MMVFDQNLIIGLAVIIVIGIVIYMYRSQLFGSGPAENFASGHAQEKKDTILPKNNGGAKDIQNYSKDNTSGEIAKSSPHAIRPTVSVVQDGAQAPV